MANTTIQEVIDSFESSFADKRVIPYDLEIVWLKKAVARYSIELDPITLNYDTEEFSSELDQYVIDTLGAYMKQSYQEREVSKVNKRVSIVTKDISIDGTNGTKSFNKYELEYDDSKARYMTQNQKPTAYV